MCLAPDTGWLEQLGTDETSLLSKQPLHMATWASFSMAVGGLSNFLSLEQEFPEDLGEAVVFLKILLQKSKSITSTIFYWSNH